MREVVKSVCRGVASIVVLPLLVTYTIRAQLIGRDRAMEGSSQLLSLVPGLVGQYVRVAFLARTLAFCPPTAAISFGTIFAQADARIEAGVYVGPRCILGLVHIGRDVLIGSGVQITSGRHTHGTDDSSIPMRDQAGTRTLVRIGE